MQQNSTLSIKISFTKFFLVLLFLSPIFKVKAQKYGKELNNRLEYSEMFVHEAKHLYDWNEIEIALAKEIGISQAACNQFFIYLRNAKQLDFIGYLNKVKSGEVNKTNAQQYWINKFPDFVKLYKKNESEVQAILSNNNQKLNNVAPPAPHVGGMNCNNLDFDNATTNGWTGRHCNGSGINYYNTAPQFLPYSWLNSSGFNNWNYVHELTTTGWDPWVPIQTTPPAHNYSLRLGNDHAAYDQYYPYNHQVISNTFTVTNSNAMLTYWYAVALAQDSGVFAHNAVDQPYFKIRMFDQFNNEITCARFDVNATSASSIGFQKQKYAGTMYEVLYKDWSPVMIPLTNYIGQNVTIQFESSDCFFGGHFGYAYLTVDCGNFEVLNSGTKLCPSGTVNLTAPTGAASYSWMGPGVIAGSNAQVATVNAAGTYTVNMTSIGNSNTICTYSMTTTVTQDGVINVSSVPTNVNCYGASTGIASVTASGGTAGYTYSWSPVNGTTNTITGVPAGNYTCTVTDAVGCSKTQTVSITQPASALNASLSSQTNVNCYGNNSGSAVIAVSGGTAAYTYAWTPTGGSNATAINLTAGNYTCTIRDNQGCTTTQSVSISQPASALTISTSNSTNVDCFGSSTGTANVAVSGGTANYSYNWQPLGATTNSVSGLSAGTHTCTVTDIMGCSVNKTFTITQPVAALNSSLSSQTNVSCYGNSTGAATITASGGSPSYTYNWLPTGGTTNTATLLSAGNYTCTITDVKGCTTSKIVTITQPSTGLSSSIVSQNNVLCYGNSSGSATISASGGANVYSYIWMPGGGNASTANNLSAGIYTCTVADGSGCTSSQTVNITQPLAPLTSIISSQTNVLCYGLNSAAASISVSGGTPTYNYSWSGLTANTSSVSALVAGSYTCTITDANGCNTTKTVIITQPASPLTVGLSAQSNVNCYGNNTGSASVFALGGTPSYTYNWTPSGGTTNSATSLAANNYTCAVTDANGCITTKEVNITQPATGLSSSVVNQTNINCYGNNTGSATVSVAGGLNNYTYTWLPNGGNSATASGLTAGNYTCSVSDGNGCTTSQQINITQPNAALSSTINEVHNVNCFGNSNGSATITINGGTPAYSYNWLPSGGNAAVADSLTAGSYTCNVTDANGCKTAQTISITQPSSALTLNVVSQTNISCYGDSTGAVQVVASNGTPYYTFSWQPISSSNSNVNALPAGNHTCTVTDVNGCVQSKIVTILQPQAITAHIQATDVCKGSTTTVNASVSGGLGSFTYNWMPGGANTAGFTTVVNSNTTYTLTITDSNNCNVNKTVNVNALPLPQANISSNATNGVFISTSDANNLCFYDNTSGASQWDWTFNNSINTNVQNPCFEIESTGKYCADLVVKNSYGCKDKATLCIEVEIQEIIFPNIFTPNNDGKNDLFTLNSKGYEGLYCEIFDRWGLRIYSWNGTNGGWDGFLENGSRAVDGTYYWFAEIKDYKGSTIKKNGHLTLAR